ncbi:MAG TPA: glycosyl hydrolase 53 family protein [Aggregatilineaceae bacterium]|nr:glycosyl hydrolase 53 family protein [Aggregatilineaceae bacterium]
MRILRIISIVFVLTLLLSAQPIAHSQASKFYFGVDLSYANEMEDCGATYQENGELVDPFVLFHDHGANLVRARLWYDPDWTNYSTLSDVKRTFTRARDAGMSTLLDIHYSDNWADPSKQEIPAAWAGKNDAELAEAIYQYTYDVLTELHAEDLTPAFVQVGNETNSGLLKANQVELDWKRDAPLFNSGIRAVRDFAAETGTDPQIILHVAQPENTTWWFTSAEEAGVTDFDVIGISYYPQWSTFSLADLGTQVKYLRQRFDKEVMIVETAYGWTRDAVDETADNILTQGIRGYSFTPEGQSHFMTDLTQTLISNGALGVVYWEPAWVSTTCSTRWGQGSHWENATFFDFQNNNEALEAINFPAYDYWYPAQLADGIIEEEYGAPLVIDSTSDVLDNIAALDLTALYIAKNESSLSLALTITGDVSVGESNYLIYFDTTHDTQGADVDPGRRPITVADPFKPEFRLDINSSGSIQFNAWIGNDWESLTFTGDSAIRTGEPSVIEIQIPLALLGQPASLNLAVVSTDRNRSHTAGDILGTDTVLSDWSAELILDQFVAVSPLE